MQKGFGLFLATFLPLLPLQVLRNSSPADWQATLFLGAQIFIQCMLLGLLAFDYVTLRQGRYDWQILFEVHGLTFIGLSVSSILAAVGAAATALLTSQATTLLNAVVNILLGKSISGGGPPGP